MTRSQGGPPAMSRMTSLATITLSENVAAQTGSIVTAFSTALNGKKKERGEKKKKKMEGKNLWWSQCLVFRTSGCSRCICGILLFFVAVPVVELQVMWYSCLQKIVVIICVRMSNTRCLDISSAKLRLWWQLSAQYVILADPFRGIRLFFLVLEVLPGYFSLCQHAVFSGRWKSCLFVTERTFHNVDVPDVRYRVLLGCSDD